MIEQFKKEVDKGLSTQPKSLPSKFFYDKTGDELFVKIMNMPEYYLSRSELEIFHEQSGKIIKGLNLNRNQYFELIELGAGDGTKTKELLEVLHTEGYKFEYIPIDISQNALDQLERKLTKELPHVMVNTKQGDYFTMLASLHNTKHQKIVFFLGSNLGNMTDKEASSFISKLSLNLRNNDKLLIGLDLIKSADIVLPAYNDSEGVTRAFNMNLLSRINNELGGDFNIDTFIHKPTYTTKTGIAQSCLVSTIDQTLTLSSTGKTYKFIEGEEIQTEISRKYNNEILTRIVEDTDFKITKKLTDKKGYFANYILHRV